MRWAFCSLATLSILSIRSILNLLLEPIKLELALSDSQLGLLGGLAFALFYTFRHTHSGFGRSYNRVKILAVSMAIWSAMTAVCGLASNWMLLLARIGVGVGEAGASPPSHSLISDYFPIEKRATALSIYALGIPFGTMIGSLLGAGSGYHWLAQHVLLGRIAGYFRCAGDPLDAQRTSSGYV